MGLVKIEEAVQALISAGIRARRGWPGNPYPSLTGPVAAVGLHRVTETETTLSCRVFCPAELGGTLCEDTAVKAAEALTELGAECVQEACSYERSASLFSVVVLASWKQKIAAVPDPDPEPEDTDLKCTVAIDGKNLPYLTGFSSRQVARMEPLRELMEGVTGIRPEEPYWLLTVEELLPDSQALEAEVYSFTVTVKRGAGTETYTGCYWQEIRREHTPAGVKQQRIARTWNERGISNG